MEETNRYKNLANSDHPATLIYLVDISGSMAAKMPDGKTRIEATKDAIQALYTEMLQRSLKQGEIRSRYRVAMIGYTDELFNVYGDFGTIVTVDKLDQEGVPALTAQYTTDMDKAFRYAAHILDEDIKGWKQKWLDESPAPMVINLTDCEFNETKAPIESAQKLMKLSVPDGNVLVENIFITDQIKVKNADPKGWEGYKFDEATGDPFGDQMLQMSSSLPSTYAQIMRERAGMKIQGGRAMLFPGINSDFIKTAFVMSTVSGTQIARPVVPEQKRD